MVVSRIADAFANINWRVGYMQRVRDGKKLGAKSFSAKTTQQLRKQSEESDLQFVELNEHLLLEVLYGGNSMLPGLDVRRLSQIYLELLGESLAIKERNRLGKVISLWPFPSTWVRKRPTAERPAYEIKIGNQTFALPAEDIFCVRNPDPSNPIVGGVGPGQALGTEIDTDEYAAEFTRAHFYNNAAPSRILAFEKINNSEAKRLQAAYRQKYQGSKKAGQVEIVGGMKPVDIRLSDSMKDADTIDLRKSVREIVTETFGVPPEIVGIIENSNRATIESADLLMARYVTGPRARKWLAYLQRLAFEYDPRLVVTFDDPAPDDQDRRLDYAKAAPWALTRGEWRERIGLEDRGETDNVHLENLSLVARTPEGEMTVPLAEPEPDSGKAKAAQGVATQKDDDDRIARIVDSLRPERLDRELTPRTKKVIKSVGNAELRKLGLSISFNMLNPKVVRFLEQYAAKRVVGINNTTRKAVRNAVVEGVKRGEGVNQLKSRIKGVFAQASTSRARTIARTESVIASSFGSREAWLQSGLVADKQWLSVIDGDTRDTHLDLQGSVVAVNELFTSSDGDQGQGPGEFALAENNINCRCASIAVVGEPKSADVCAKLWRQKEAERLAIETGYLSSAKHAFTEQERDVLEALAQIFGTA